MAITATPGESPAEIRIGVFVYDGCSAWIVAGILESFAIANALARRALGPRQPIAFRVGTVSPLGRTVIATHRIRFESVRPRVPLDVLVVPPIWHQSAFHLVEALEDLSPILKGLVALAGRSRLVTSACSGAVLLAEAGLLEGKKATTCWWLTDWFRTRFPRVGLAPDRLLVTDGSTWTAAAGSAYVHLCLRVIDYFAGKELSALTARFVLVEPNRETQVPYFSNQVAGSESERLSCFQRFVFKHVEHPISVSELAGAANMSVRSLFRFFEKQQGTTPLQFVQGIRIAHAKNLLERTDDPMDWIAPKCGYEDVSSFRKLFRKRVGMTAKEYRQRFGRARQ